MSTHADETTISIRSYNVDTWRFATSDGREPLERALSRYALHCGERHPSGGSGRSARRADRPWANGGGITWRLRGDELVFRPGFPGDFRSMMFWPSARRSKILAPSLMMYMSLLASTEQSTPRSCPPLLKYAASSSALKWTSAGIGAACCFDTPQSKSSAQRVWVPPCTFGGKPAQMADESASQINGHFRLGPVYQLVQSSLPEITI